MLDVDREAPDLRAPAAFVEGQGGRLFVAQGAPGQVDGTVSVVPDGADHWRVHRMYVAASRRGTGLADALLDRAEATARAAGAATLSLHTDSRFTRAHAFYERRSFLRRHPAAVLHDLANTVDLLHAKPLAGRVVEQLDAAAAGSAVRRFTAILVECAARGDFVPFHHPLPVARARAFWQGVAAAVAAGRVLLFGAWLDGVLAGTVTLDVDARPNGRHRAGVSRLLVAPAARRRGVANALMDRVEAAAWALGRSLLVLDTMSGSHGERLYRARGWTEAGGIPGYSRDAAGTPEDMTLFYKTLPGQPAP